MSPRQKIATMASSVNWRNIKRGIYSFWLVLLLAGCGGFGGAASTPTPTPSPDEIIDQVMAATEDASSFRFAIDFEGAPVYADPVNEQFAIVSVEGSLERPAGARAQIRVRTTGVIGIIRLVSLEGQLYATNPITREWLCFPPDSLFDPLVLFESERGLDYLIREEFTDVALEGIEPFGENDRLHYHLTGTIDGAPLRDISMGLLGRDTVDAEVWADTETQLVSRLVLTDQAPDTETTTVWTMDLDNYNQDVDIRAPVECE
jgi:lipoprotein LprG